MTKKLSKVKIKAKANNTLEDCVHYYIYKNADSEVLCEKNSEKKFFFLS